MNNHTKLTPEQYDAATLARESALNSGTVTRHRPEHNFPVMTDKQVAFRLKVQDDMIADLMRRVDKLETKEFARNLPSNQVKRVEDE